MELTGKALLSKRGISKYEAMKIFKANLNKLEEVMSDIPGVTKEDFFKEDSGVDIPRLTPKKLRDFAYYPEWVTVSYFRVPREKILQAARANSIFLEWDPSKIISSTPFASASSTSRNKVPQASPLTPKKRSREPVEASNEIHTSISSTASTSAITSARKTTPKAWGSSENQVAFWGSKVDEIDKLTFNVNGLKGNELLNVVISLPKSLWSYEHLYNALAVQVGMARKDFTLIFYGLFEPTVLDFSSMQACCLMALKGGGKINLVLTDN